MNSRTHSEVSALESLLMMLTPEQQEDVLRSAQSDGVIYLNRIPAFDKPLAMRLTQRALTKLEAWYNDLHGESSEEERFAYLKQQLEMGVQIFPPPLDWIENPKEGEDLPVRIETESLGIPCKLELPKIPTGRPCLHAVYLGAPNDQRPTELDDDQDETDDEDKLQTTEEQSSGIQVRHFKPNVQTTWHVSSSYNMPDIDGEALHSLVKRLAVSRSLNGLSKEIRQRCQQFKALIALKEFAAQLPYSLESSAGEEVELRVSGHPEILNGLETVRVFAVSNDKSSRTLIQDFYLEQVRKANGNYFFIAKNWQGVSYQPTAGQIPLTGFIADSGEVSQLGKQAAAVRAIRNPQYGPAHLSKLGMLLTGAHLPLAKPVPWNAIDLEPLDLLLTTRQLEAVRKAISTPDVCLIQGPPGTGKTRVISEIVRQAVLANQKVLLVAPTHVAVDNVLERIGLHDEVSPVRCVHEKKLEGLPEHIQDMTFHRRREFVVSETQVRSTNDRDKWHDRANILQHDINVVREGLRLRECATAIERKLANLENKKSKLPGEIQKRFSDNTNKANQDIAAAEVRLTTCQQTKSQCDKRLSDLKHHLEDLSQHTFNSREKKQLATAESSTKEEHKVGIDEAIKERDKTAKRLRNAKSERTALRSQVDETTNIVRQLDASEIPPIVQRVIDSAITEVTHEQDKFVAASAKKLKSAEKTLQRTVARISKTTRRQQKALAKQKSLAQVSSHSLPQKMLSMSWWGSLVSDYQRIATAAEEQLARFAEEKPSLEQHLDRCEREQHQAVLLREQRISQTRNEAFDQQRQHFAELAANLAEKLNTQDAAIDAMQIERDGHERRHLELVSLRDAAICEAREVVRKSLLATVQVDVDAETHKLEKATAELVTAKDELILVKATLKKLEETITDTISQEMEKLVEEATIQHEDLVNTRQTFDNLLPRLNSLDKYPAFRAGSINDCINKLDRDHDYARRRYELLQEWTQYLSRHGDQLSERLANYINLVCATTMGIATDAFFGDRKEHEEKEFDLLVIDEAGKVTEPEFIVAASRARKWVLVGDHKQLPPYYDQILDPFIHRVNEERREQLLVPLDSAILQMSLFERLWNMHQPTLQDAGIAESAENQKGLANYEDAFTSREAAFERAEQEAQMWQEHRSIKDEDITVSDFAEQVGIPVEEACSFLIFAGYDFDEEKGKSRCSKEMQQAITVATEDVYLVDDAGSVYTTESLAEDIGLSVAAINDHMRAEGFDVLRPHKRVKRNLQVDHEWLSEKLNRESSEGQDPGESRCVTLDVQRRMHPDLAQFISEMFYENEYYSPDDDTFIKRKTLAIEHFPHAVTFINVGAKSRDDHNESELNNLKIRKQLERQCGGSLPVQGYANKREAVQVVTVLEALVHDSAIRHELDELRRDNDHIPVIGVIAFYSGQVALIRNLLRKSKALDAKEIAEDQWICQGVKIAVNTVHAFQGKECSIILLSFTRSNRSQKIGFVDDGHVLNVALSRARKKLILIGDAETLIRRAKQRGKHSGDSRLARQERLFFVRLVEYVEGRGKTMSLFQMRKGNE